MMWSSDLESGTDAQSRVTAFTCGPSSERCRCECSSSGGCEHVFDGVARPETGSICSRCGMTAMEHDQWMLP